MKKNLIIAIIAVGAQIVGAQNLVPQQAQTIIYVKPAGTGDGSSWANACNLEHAVGNKSAVGMDFTPTPPQIWVQKGTYHPSAMLSIPNSVKMYGGFNGTETQLSQRDSLSNATIIDAEQKFGSVVRLGVSAELNGFVIQNGNANDNPHKNGGGVFADDNSVIANCLIINNAASARGGGIYSKGPVRVINTTVRDNVATGGGYNVFGNCLTWIAGSGLSDEVVSIEHEEPVACTAPVISSHPSTAAQSKDLNAAFSALSVSATGTAPLTYQWYSNSTNSNSGGTKVGTNSSSYTPSSATVGALYYYCVVTNSCGSATSNVSGLHTVTAPIVTTGCNSSTLALGTVGFATSQSWTVGSQTWSDVVVASNCNKTGYDGGTTDNFNSDCRNATNVIIFRGVRLSSTPQRYVREIGECRPKMILWLWIRLWGVKVRMVRVW